MEKHVRHRIEAITPNNLNDAVTIRAQCYVNDYAGVLSEEKIAAYDFENDFQTIKTWLYENSEDYRVGYIYYIDQEAVGMAIGSMSDLGNHMASAELNYLFVSERARGLQIGKKLMIAVAIKYRELGVKELLLYNWRILKSNEFYRHLNPLRIETIIQHPSGKPLETDIFYWSLEGLIGQLPVNKIIWFSGTGGVQHVAETLSSKLLQRGKLAITLSMSEALSGYYPQIMETSEMPTENLFVLFPVYAMAEPAIVKEWIATLPSGEHSHTIVLSVSGGGEVWPNTSCRRKVIQMLTNKGYSVVYERMLVMPPNMLIEAEPDLVTYLLQELPRKLQDVLLDLENGVVRRDRIKLSTAWLRFASNMEQNQVKTAAKYFVVTDQCTGCGHCEEYCPVHNIKMSEVTHRPIFDDKCLLCLKCYYRCPIHAITAPKLEKWLLKSYNMEAMKALEYQVPQKPVEACCKGLMWSGVKRYLTEIKF